MKIPVVMTGIAASLLAATREYSLREMPQRLGKGSIYHA